MAPHHHITKHIKTIRGHDQITDNKIQNNYKQILFSQEISCFSHLKHIFIKNRLCSLREFSFDMFYFFRICKRVSFICFYLSHVFADFPGILHRLLRNLFLKVQKQNGKYQITEKKQDQSRQYPGKITFQKSIQHPLCPSKKRNIEKIPSKSKFYIVQRC